MSTPAHEELTDGNEFMDGKHRLTYAAGLMDYATPLIASDRAARAVDRSGRVWFANKDNNEWKCRSLGITLTAMELAQLAPLDFLPMEEPVVYIANGVTKPATIPDMEQKRRGKFWRALRNGTWRCDENGEIADHDTMMNDVNATPALDSNWCA